MDKEHSGWWITVEWKKRQLYIGEPRAPPPTHTSVWSFRVPKALSSLPSQAILARWGNRSPAGKPKATHWRSCPGLPAPTCPKGDISGFVATVTGLGDLRAMRGEPVLSGAPHKHTQSPAQSSLCHGVLRASLGGAADRIRLQVAKMRGDNTPEPRSPTFRTSLTSLTAGWCPLPQSTAASPQMSPSL